MHIVFVAVAWIYMWAMHAALRYIEIKNRFISHANFFRYVLLLIYMYVCSCIIEYDQTVACF